HERSPGRGQRERQAGRDPGPRLLHVRDDRPAGDDRRRARDVEGAPRGGPPAGAASLAGVRRALDRHRRVLPGAAAPASVVAATFAPEARARRAGPGRDALLARARVVRAPACSRGRIPCARIPEDSAMTTAVWTDRSHAITTGSL